MEKNLFKNKKRVMDCDDSIGWRAAGELKSNIFSLREDIGTDLRLRNSRRSEYIFVYLLKLVIINLLI